MFVFVYFGLLRPGMGKQFIGLVLTCEDLAGEILVGRCG